MTENEISKILVDVCFNVHKKLGPGLLESVYETIICHELDKLEIPYQRQQGIKVIYDTIAMDMGFRADIIVDKKVIVELKSIEAIAPVHCKVVLTYLRLTNIRLALLVNFNVALIKDGITRIVNNL